MAPNVHQSPACGAPPVQQKKAALKAIACNMQTRTSIREPPFPMMSVSALGFVDFYLVRS